MASSRDGGDHDRTRDPALVTLFLFLAALLGGALNSVAGGGSFIALPALLYAGISPVSANATTTFALWPGSVSSAFAYRREIAGSRPLLALLGAVSVVGGFLGGFLLVRTSDVSFMRLLPWLMLLAAVAFTFGGTVQRSLRRWIAPGGWPLAPGIRPGIPPWVPLFQLAVAIYGGYFGGGIGIMMLAAMSVAGMTNIHQMNGLKTALAVAINSVALAEFIASGLVAWTPGLVMVAGGIVGGYTGAATARLISPRYVRAFVVAVAWVMTMYFFFR